MYVQRDHKAREDQIGDFTPVSEAQRAACRLVICDRAIDAEDAAELMRALGVHPDQHLDTYLTGPAGPVNSTHGLAVGS